MYDPQKHNALVEKYVCRFSYNLTEREDLRQETYLRLWRAGEIPDSELERFVADAVQDAITKVRPDVMELPLFISSLQELSTPQAEWEKIPNESLYTALAGLTEPEKTVMTLIFGLGCPPRSGKKTAKYLGRTEWWVRKQKKSALKKLKRMLEK